MATVGIFTKQKLKNQNCFLSESWLLTVCMFLCLVLHIQLAFPSSSCPPHRHAWITEDERASLRRDSPLSLFKGLPLPSTYLHGPYYLPVIILITYMYKVSYPCEEGTITLQMNKQRHREGKSLSQVPQAGFESKGSSSTTICNCLSLRAHGRIGRF